MNILQIVRKKLYPLIKIGWGNLLKMNYMMRGTLGRYVYLGQYVTNRNFGDALGFLMAKLLPINSGRVIPQRLCFDWMYKRGLNLQFIGSTLSDADNNSVIIGAGAVSKDIVLKAKPYKVFSVRGPLTRKVLVGQGIECPEKYGDPAVLLPQLYLPSVKKKYKVGFIPHYVDQEKDVVKQICDCSYVHFINILLSPNRGKPSIFSEWKSWVDDLCSCEVIVSSSLHGLILADAYKIPSLWVKFGNDINGNDFKFYDYYASLGITDVHPKELYNKLPVSFVDDFCTEAKLHDVSCLQVQLQYLFNLKI